MASAQKAGHPEPCGVCRRQGALHQATRDDTLLCPACWTAYEAACDAAEAYWLAEAQSDAEIGAGSEAAGAPLRTGAGPDGAEDVPPDLQRWLLLVADYAYRQ